MNIYPDDLYIGVRSDGGTTSRLAIKATDEHVIYTTSTGMTCQCGRITFERWAAHAGHRLAARDPKHREVA